MWMGGWDYFEIVSTSQGGQAHDRRALWKAPRSQGVGNSGGCSASPFKKFLLSLLFNPNQETAPGFASHLLLQTSLSPSFPGSIRCQLLC